MIETHARKTDPITSHMAAKEIQSIRPTQVDRVVAAVKKYPGMTSHELSEKTGLDRYMIARRLPDAKPRVFCAGYRKCRVSNKTAQVWKITE